MNIKTFDQISDGDISLVGGKALSLGIMTRRGISVPSGFVIPADRYSTGSYDEILRAFDALGEEFVAVRSSAVAEDSVNTSWAGQLETYLHVKRDNLLESIEKCLASMNADKARSYAAHNNIQDDLGMAVVVQKMVDSRVSGVIFTVNPVTKNNDEIMLEAVYGPGELLVQGLVTPLNILLDKNTLEVKEKTEGQQETIWAFEDNVGRQMPLPIALQYMELLSDEHLKELGKIALQIEDIYKRPQDIEWAIEGDEIFILQSRPITTL